MTNNDKYDDNNIFARILRDEIPAKKVIETEHALAFEDVNPQAPVHILVIPKVPCRTLFEFCSMATEAQQAGLFSVISKVVEQFDLEQTGYRVIANNLQDARQEVFHLHFHVLGGRDLGSMLEQK